MNNITDLLDLEDADITITDIQIQGQTKIRQVLHEPERRPQTKSYMWLFRSGEDGGPPIIFYKYSETRAGDNAANFLHGFKGYLMCDGYSGYNKVPDAKRTACWAHIRRYLTDAIPKGKALDYTQPSVQGMLYINKLLHMKNVIKTNYSSFDAIKKARLEKEKPVVEGFLSWLDQQKPARGSRMVLRNTRFSSLQEVRTPENHAEPSSCPMKNSSAVI